jgi:hypothetical protein
MKTHFGRVAPITALTITFLVLFSTVATTSAKTPGTEQPAPASSLYQQDRVPGSPVPAQECCVCPQGSSYNAEHKSCVKPVCVVKGMPDGDKGGGFFSLHGTIFESVDCLPVPDLNLTVATGQAGWKVSGPGAGPAPVNVTPYSGWSAPLSTPFTSSWISINANRGDPPGKAADFTYTFEFCLCEGFLKPQLTAKLLADNCVTSVTLNGNPVPASPGGPFMSSACPRGFTGGPYPYATSTSSFFHGTNTVSIVVHNDNGPTGLDAIFHITAVHGQCPRRTGGVVGTGGPADPR